VAGAGPPLAAGAGAEGTGGTIVAAGPDAFDAPPGAGPDLPFLQKKNNAPPIAPRTTSATTTPMMIPVESPSESDDSGGDGAGMLEPGMLGPGPPPTVPKG